MVPSEVETETMSFPTPTFDRLRGMWRYRDTFAPLKALRLGPDGKTPQAYDLTPDLVGADAAGTAETLIESLRNGWTPERAFVSDESGQLALSDVTAAELLALAGISGNVQSQLNGRSLVGHNHEMVETNGLLAAMSNKADLIGGKIPESQINHTIITEYKGEAANEMAMLAIPDVGMSDWVYRTDLQTAFMLALPDSSLASSWRSLGPTNGIVTVNGVAGSHITLGYGDVGACSASDSRLSNARTPLAHAASHLAGGSDPITITMAQVSDSSALLAAKANLSSANFTGPVTISNNGTFRQDHSAGNYVANFHIAGSQYAINKHTSTGQAVIVIDPRPSDGSGHATVSLFRNTNTGGDKTLLIHSGNGSSAANAALSGNGNSYVNALWGGFGVGIDLPAAKLHVFGTTLLEGVTTLTGRMRFGLVSSVPSTSGATAGEAIFVTTGTPALYVYNGTAWQRFAVAA